MPGKAFIEGQMVRYYTADTPRRSLDINDPENITWITSHSPSTLFHLLTPGPIFQYPTKAYTLKHAI